MWEFDTSTARVRDVYDRTARHYDAMIAFWERILFRGGREWVCRQARGDVLELAVGTGRNLPLYSSASSVVGVDVSEEMLRIARARSQELALDIELEVGDAQELGFSDGSFDTVVSTLSLCSIPDERRALSEAYRVLKPDGVLLLLEHVRSPVTVIHAGQRLLEPIFLRFLCDHLTREPLESVPRVGFEVQRVERRRLGIVELLRARRPT